MCSPAPAPRHRPCLALGLAVGLALVGGGCRTDGALWGKGQPEPAAELEIRPIDVVQDYGPLFVDVQMAGVFEDSKTFVDMVPREPVDTIVGRYARERQTAGFDLTAFVEKHFELPSAGAKGFATDSSLSLDGHIERLWPILGREAARQPTGGTLLPLPNDYIVPGGRFREIYYWDTYFTMLGLLADGREAEARGMVANFAELIETYGFIPNGNRSYYLSRSQPPFFASMVALVADSLRAADSARGDAYLVEYLPALRREHAYWMRGTEAVAAVGDSREHAARIATDLVVARYYDYDPRPRPEGYREDSLLARGSARPPAELYRDLRSACESGWDFSARWLSDPADLGTIRTTRIAPVDLNSLLYFLEDLLAQGYAIAGDEAEEQRFARLAYERRRAVLSKFFDRRAGLFMDYDLDARTTTSVKTLAGVYPLYFGIATDEQAAAVAQTLEREFLRPGGLVTTLQASGQQWDAPNGWPPLQWVAIAGLRRYGHTALAREIAARWLASGRKVYARTGKVVEKYNVVDTALLAGGGEYPNQDGFGWSNGVFARLLADYPDLR